MIEANIFKKVGEGERPLDSAKLEMYHWLHKPMGTLPLCFFFFFLTLWELCRDKAKAIQGLHYPGPHNGFWTKPAYSPEVEEENGQRFQMMFCNETEGKTLPGEMRKIHTRKKAIMFLLFLFSFLTPNILHESSPYLRRLGNQMTLALWSPREPRR